MMRTTKTPRRRPTRLMIAAMAACVVGLCSPTPVLAQDEAPPPEVEVTSHNAALLYHRVWMNMDRELQNLYNSVENVQTLAEGGAEMLSENQQTVRAILKATRQEHTDWNVEYEQGPFALLPHLGKMRGTARVLAADVLRCAQEGDSDGAAERICAIYRSAGHLSNDRILISSLVGMAISNLANRLSVKLGEEGTLTAESAETILAALNSFDLDDPCGMRSAVEGERDLLLDYFLTNFTGADAGAEIVALEDLFFGEAKDQAQTMAELDGEALRLDTQGYLRFHDEVMAAWDEPNAADLISKLGEGVSNGDYGVFAQVFAASFEKTRQNTDRFIIDYNETTEAMERIVNP